MEHYRRYAVYFAPSGGLARFGAAWLGWDAEARAVAERVSVEDLPRSAEAITETPRKYGFHGTLKPPFRLAEGQTVEALDQALRDLAASAAPVLLEGMALSRLGAFLAVTPQGDAGALAALAARLVQELDGFRAPAGEAELAKRRARGLTPAQEANLTAWGYPYVLGEFRFHLTLTGRLAAEEIGAVEAALAPHLAPLLPAPFPIDEVALFGEAEDGRFHILHRYALTG